MLTHTHARTLGLPRTSAIQMGTLCFLPRCSKETQSCPNQPSRINHLSTLTHLPSGVASPRCHTTHAPHCHYVPMPYKKNRTRELHRTRKTRGPTCVVTGSVVTSAGEVCGGRLRCHQLARLHRPGRANRPVRASGIVPM